MGLDIFKLEKLKLLAFSDKERKTPIGKPFEAMYNPASYAQTHQIPWVPNMGLSSSGQVQAYAGGLSSELSLDLILDGTGVDEMGVVALARPSVKDRIKAFFDATIRYNGNIHEPNFLRVKWGSSLSFDCRLYRSTIKYTLFDPGGDPLRAELSLRLVSDSYSEALDKAADKKSPDVTHARVVKHGDTLPLLTRAVYGSSARYLDVARWNGLDDFRRLTPGQQLFFPPLAALGDGSGAR